MDADGTNEAKRRAGEPDAFGPRRKRVDPIDMPPRPLGSKRAALRRRKLQGVDVMRCGGAGTSTLHSDERVLRSDDGLVFLVIREVPQGLWFERHHAPPSGRQTSLTMLFEDAVGLIGWCDLDPLRVPYKTLYEQLRLHGLENVGAGR